ncbi:hypothetical protein VT84_06995 [Gemmata sp. SH-PL17]|uniref:hypothetical protein n=1 Tax=Gemmata sp. SH-PL17 TaxID=1630693 RepID=UPI00078E68D1|nr:hypothetical protein [Gemmata sp. SH-PL17]AMV24126.1 hypothetical protein VT84_06995 [Gemmata sp. SH-PL17]
MGTGAWLRRLERRLARYEVAQAAKRKTAEEAAKRAAIIAEQAAEQAARAAATRAAAEKVIAEQAARAAAVKAARDEVLRKREARVDRMRLDKSPCDVCRSEGRGYTEDCISDLHGCDERRIRVVQEAWAEQDRYEAMIAANHARTSRR